MMWTRRSVWSSAVALLVSASLFHHVDAQVSTDCQPLNRTDCPPNPAFGMDFNFNFNATPSAWETTVGPVTYDGTNGAAFTINKQGDSPTIRSKFYIFFGRVEVWMKAAAGTGIISSVMFLSDDLDEIDWEFMGGNHTHAETNYFGKGVQDFHNAIYYPVENGIVDDFHNYTTHWTKDALEFYIDGQLVRTLLPKDANNTLYYPQTPMRISLGIWAGGDPTLAEGTRQWAGGDTDYSQAPFSMYVRSAHVTDFSQGKEYTYGDTSGSFESIRITAGNSTAKDEVTAVPEVHKSMSEKWNELSPTARTAVYASAAGVGTVLVALMGFYCIKQRRRGAREARIAEAKWNEEQRELAAFKAAGVDPDSFSGATGAEYNAKEMARETVTSVPNTPGSPTEKWQSAAVGAGAGVAAAAAPLLRNDHQSPRAAGSGPQRSLYDASPAIPAVGYGQPNNARSPSAPLISPMGSAGPAIAPALDHQQFAQQPSRSFTTPNVQLRTGSPGPQQGFGGAPPSSQPQRSFTTGGYSAATYGHSQSDQYWGHDNHR